MALQHNVNQTPTTGAHAVAQFIAVLALAGWTVHGWSNGTTVTRDGSAPTGNDLAHTKAWVEVVRPSSTNTIVFQRGASNLLWWVAEADGGLNTGGNGTTVDTAVYSDLCNVRGTVGAPAQLFADDGTYRASAIADDATARSVLLCWKIATGERYTEISTDPITGMHSLDVCDLATRAAFAEDTIFQANRRRDIPAMTWCGKTGTAVGLEWCAFQLCSPRVYNGVSIAPAGVSLSVFDNKFQVVGGLVGVVVRAWPNGNDLKGYSTLVKLAATAMTNFDTLDVGSLDEDLIALDNCLLPWPHGIAPLV